DATAVSALVAYPQRQKNVDDSRETPAGDICRQHWRHDRPIGRTGRESEQTGIPDIIDVVPGLVNAWPALAVAGDRAIDQFRVDLLQFVVAETEPVHHAGTELLNHNVRALDQRHELFAVSVALQIERHA